MPIFEYQCAKCGAVTEFLEKAGAAGAHVCQQCGSKAMKKVLSTFAAHAAPDASSCAAGQCRPGAACRPTACPSGRCPLG